MKKENLALLIAILLPILMIVAIGLTSFISNNTYNPTERFLYAAGSQYGGVFYYVSGGKLTKRIPAYRGYTSPVKSEIKFFIYDAATDSIKAVSFDDASQLNLDSNTVSPDGYTLANGYHNIGGFPLFVSGESDYSWYLKKNSFSRKLSLDAGGLSNWNIFFLGWIKHDTAK